MLRTDRIIFLATVGALLLCAMPAVADSGPASPEAICYTKEQVTNEVQMNMLPGAKTLKLSRAQKDGLRQGLVSTGARLYGKREFLVFSAADFGRVLIAGFKDDCLEAIKWVPVETFRLWIAGRGVAR